MLGIFSFFFPTNNFSLFENMRFVFNDKEVIYTQLCYRYTKSRVLIKRKGLINHNNSLIFDLKLHIYGNVFLAAHSRETFICYP